MTGKSKQAPSAQARGAKGKRGGRGRGRGGGGAKKAVTPKVATRHSPTLTSHPTGRAAYLDTRKWLLATHGPVCAYCERIVAERTVTLDHVTPRRGLTAYDRRDNLVLCCKTCNAAKADKPILVFLLGNRARVVALYKYGQHLSHQLVEMVKDLLPAGDRPPLPTGPPPKPRAKRKSWAEMHPHEDEGLSPYLDG
ncbi:MAG: HNH endonuclease signature motif containing protein [Gemmatimonadaceae bacterium]